MILHNSFTLTLALRLQPTLNVSEIQLATLAFPKQVGRAVAGAIQRAREGNSGVAGRLVFSLKRSGKSGGGGGVGVHGVLTTPFGVILVGLVRFTVPRDKPFFRLIERSRIWAICAALSAPRRVASSTESA